MAISKIILNGVTQIDLTQDTVANASHIMNGYVGHLVDGTQVTGTGQGGSTPSATQHTIHFEFTDETTENILVYYDSSFIGNAITATVPTTYNNKTVALAQLDNVTWYTEPTETYEVLYESNNCNYFKDDNDDYPYCWIQSLSDVYPTNGSIWRITFNGTVYECTAESISNIVVVGNPFYSPASRETDVETGVPFGFYNAGWGAWTGGANLPNEAGSYPLKIERLVTS